MKKIILIALALCLTTTPMVFAANQDNCGCGLGTMVMEGKDGLVFDLLATITNATSGNQTFGITSGTLGCEQNSKIAMNDKVDTFVADNMDNLAIDIASGQGETLDALAEIAEIDSSAKADLYATLQMNFDNIYSSSDISAQDVSAKILALLV